MSRPLDHHNYHSKTNAELLYIIRDASEAAIAMRGTNDLAERKYLDQVNDAITIMAFRRQRRTARQH